MRQAQIANKVRIITFTANKTPTTVIVVYSDGNGKANSVLSGDFIQRKKPQQHGVLHHCTVEIRHGTTEIPLTLLRTPERINMDAPKDEKHRSPVKTANPPQAQQSHDEYLNDTLLDDIKNIVNLLERIKSNMQDRGHTAQLEIAATQVADSIRFKLIKTTTQYKILDCFLQAIGFGGIGKMITRFTGGLTGITQCSITAEEATAALAKLGSPITPEDAQSKIQQLRRANNAAANQAPPTAATVFGESGLNPPKKKILHLQIITPKDHTVSEQHTLAAAIGTAETQYNQASPAKRQRLRPLALSPTNKM
jgi:hypothetical protein